MTMAKAGGAANDATVHVEPPNPHDVERAPQDVALAEAALQRLHEKIAKMEEHLTATAEAIPAAEAEVDHARALLAALTGMEG